MRGLLREGIADVRDMGATNGEEDGFCAFFCIKQWILNQFDLLPYRHPDLDIPTFRHFFSRQALQDVLFLLSITQI